MAGKITKVFNAADQIQADVIHDHLKQNGIESMSKQPGTGIYEHCDGVFCLWNGYLCPGRSESES